MKFVCCFMLVVLFVSSNYCLQLPNGGKIWALLVAGSNGYDNYRHQADVCHAYQILHRNGIPDENIIVMMYDDIANNAENPRGGEIINKPGGENVYAGVIKDYTGEDVNSTNFLKVLTGDEDAMRGIGSGKVVKSGPNDYIFVNFVDHGAPGLIAFPEDELYATDLEDALQSMVNKTQFNKMVLYVEACESGSMFESLLPDDTNIFVMTASDPHESSYACYWDETLQAYLGDVFSVKWMEDADIEDLTKESLHHQFEVVRSETNTSHVEEYGDLDIGVLKVSNFIGADSSRRPSNTTPRRVTIDDAVPSHHVPVAVLERKLEATTHPEKREHLQFQIHKLLKLRHQVEGTMKMILGHLFSEDEAKIQSITNARYGLTRQNFGCYKELATYFSSTCYKFSENPYALRQLYILVNLCADGSLAVSAVKTAMDEICANRHIHVKIV